MSRLVLVEEGVATPREYALRAELTIGRTHCDITIDDPGVARRHAVIEHFSSGFGVRPLHPDASVVVNDQPVTTECILAAGDRIRIGGVTLRVKPAEAASMPAAPHGPRGDVPAPDPVPKAVSALVESAGIPAGQFAPPAQSSRRRGSQATRGYVTLIAFLIVLVDAIAIVIYLSMNN